MNQDINNIPNNDGLNNNQPLNNTYNDQQQSINQPEIVQENLLAGFEVATTEPVVQPVPEPVQPAMPEPIEQPVSEPFAQPVMPEPVVQLVPEPIQPAMPELVAQPIPEPVQPAMPEPIQQPVSEPVVQPKPDLLAGSGTDTPVEPTAKKKKSIIPLLIIVLLIIVAGVIFLFKDQIFGNGGNPGGGPKSMVGKEGKIPYNKEVNECALSFIEYKDNTRDLCRQDFIMAGKDIYTDTTIEEQRYSLFLDKDEKIVVSYDWKSEDKDIAAFKMAYSVYDDNTNDPVYVFQEMNESLVVILSLPDSKKFDIFDLTNATEEEQDGVTIYTGKFKQQFAYQQHYVVKRKIVKYGDLDVAITYFGKYSKALETIDIFSKYISLDNGAPFLADYVITNHPFGNPKDGQDLAYYVKSYKYIDSFTNLEKVGRYVSARTGLNYNIKVDDILFKYSTYDINYSYAKNNKVYRTETYLDDTQEGIWSTYVKDDDVFAVTVKPYSTSYTYGYYVSKPNMTLKEQYYIDKFTSVLTTKAGKSVGNTKEYVNQ